MAKVEGLTIKVTADLDDDVKALVAGYKQQVKELRKENENLKRALKSTGEMLKIAGKQMRHDDDDDFIGLTD